MEYILNLTTTFCFQYYGDKLKSKNSAGLEYDMKVMDMHRQRWEIGDWTDDSDQMLLIVDSILDKNGQVDAVDYANKFSGWVYNGYPELGDKGGLGIGATTYKVIQHHLFNREPHAVSNVLLVIDKYSIANMYVSAY